MPDDLEQSIRDNAAGPAQAHGDAGGMKQHAGYKTSDGLKL